MSAMWTRVLVRRGLRETGKVVVVWPGSHIAYARATARVDLTTYKTGTRAGA